MCCYIILAAARAEERDEILREWCACAEENISLLRGGDGGRGGLDGEQTQEERRTTLESPHFVCLWTPGSQEGILSIPECSHTHTHRVKDPLILPSASPSIRLSGLGP